MHASFPVRMASLSILCLTLNCAETGPAGSETDAGTTADIGAPDGGDGTGTPDSQDAPDSGEVEDSGGLTDAEDASPPVDSSDTEDSGADTTLPDVAADAGNPPCETALMLDADHAYQLPYTLSNIDASGGTGAYVFSLEADGSGALVNALTGAYLSGGIVDTTDVIRVTDLGCEGMASMPLHVVAPQQFAPSGGEVLPGIDFQFVTTGGSGSTIFDFQLQASGGNITPGGHYTAGSIPGTDIILATDTGTGESTEIEITVNPAATLKAPAQTLHLPLGETWKPDFQGGTGEVTLTILPTGIASLEEGVLVGTAPGIATVEALDLHTGQTAILDLRVLPPISPAFKPAGDQLYYTRILSPGDLNGDGLNDIVVADGELDVSAWNGGAVLVHAGTEEGLDPVPSQILSGKERDERLGVGIAIADLDGDGEKDLVIGAPHRDAGIGDNGILQIHPGVAGGFFQKTPSQTLIGPGGSDRLGWSIAVCDVNGDGRLDIASGMYTLDHDDPELAKGNEGGLHVYLGYPDGYLSEPDIVRFGEVLNDAGKFEGRKNLYAGYNIIGGDWNGDGLCDLAVHASGYGSLATGGTQDGAIAVYMGMPPTDITLGGITPQPAYVFTSDDALSKNSWFGRRLLFADVNGDSIEDLVVGQHQHHRALEPGEATSASNDEGAVRIWLGGDQWGTDPAKEHLPASTADITLVGPNKYDHFGYDIARHPSNSPLGDTLAVGAYNGEIPNSADNNHGSVHFFTWDATAETLIPNLEGIVEGPLKNGRFGSALGVRDDGDGELDLVVHEAHSSVNGYFAGMLHEVRRPVDAPPLLTPLSWPATISGTALGSGGDLVGDLDGDGYNDAILAAKLSDHASSGVDAGSLHLVRGGPDGFNPVPDQSWIAFEGYSATSFNPKSDHLGFAVSRGGDFNGDGLPDFFAISRAFDSPGSMDGDHYTGGGGCPFSQSGIGAAYVFSGGDPPLRNQPIAAFWGPQAGGVLETVTGGLDINNDGFSDLVTGSRYHDPNGSDSGRLVVVSGRPNPSATAEDAAPLTELICKTEFTWNGLTAGDHAGSAITRMGDLNQDGCDDFAFSEPRREALGNNDGGVHVVLGWGGVGCPEGPTSIRIASNNNGSYAGSALAGGEDADNDGIPDLLIGGYNLNVNGNNVGGAWFVPGSYLLTLEATPLVTGSEGTIPWQPMVPAGISGTYRIDGTHQGGRFGWSVAMIAHGAGPGRAALAIGEPRGALAGTPLSGGVHVFQVHPAASELAGVDLSPIALVIGESTRPNGQIGEVVSGSGDSGVPSLFIGGTWGNGVGLDTGSAYLTELLP